jgi:hypothetical protein
VIKQVTLVRSVEKRASRKKMKEFFPVLVYYLSEERKQKAFPEHGKFKKSSKACNDRLSHKGLEGLI